MSAGHRHRAPTAAVACCCRRRQVLRCAPAAAAHPSSSAPTCCGCSDGWSAVAYASTSTATPSAAVAWRAVPISPAAARRAWADPQAHTSLLWAAARQPLPGLRVPRRFALGRGRVGAARLLASAALSPVRCAACWRIVRARLQAASAACCWASTPGLCEPLRVLSAYPSWLQAIGNPHGGTVSTTCAMHIVQLRLPPVCTM